MSDHSKHTCTCRECGETMRVDLQHWPHKDKPMVLVACDNEGCALGGFTFDAETYPAKDLKAYYK